MKSQQKIANQCNINVKLDSFSVVCFDSLFFVFLRRLRVQYIPVMKFISLFRRNHNQGNPSEGVRPYQQPPLTMESAVFPPNNKQPQETEKLQQQQPQHQQIQQQQLQKEIMDIRGATAVGLSPISTIDRPENVAEYIEELEKLRVENGRLKV